MLKAVASSAADATGVTAASTLTLNQIVVGSDGARGVKTADTTITGNYTFASPLTVQGGSAAFPNDSVYLGPGVAPNKLTNVTSANDVVIGRNSGLALPANTLSFHTFVGMDTGSAASLGTGGTVVGQKAATSATTLHSSVAVGSKSGSLLSHLEADTFVGYGAAQFSDATNLGRRISVGYGAGDRDNGDYNILIGYFAGAHSGQSATSAQRNIGLGALTLAALSTGSENIGIGYQALTSVVSSVGNISIGHQAGQNTTAASNTFVGYNAGQANITGSANVYLGIGAGNNAPTSQSNTFICGNDGSGGGNRIDSIYFGKGYAAASPTGYTFFGTGGSGSNVVGGSITLTGGLSTGSGVSADLIFRTGVAPGAGSPTVAATATTALTIKGETQAVVVSAGKTLQLGNAATTGLTAGVLAALTNASIVITDSTGQAYRIPCII